MSRPTPERLAVIRSVRWRAAHVDELLNELDAVRAELAAAEKHVEIANAARADWHSRYEQAVAQASAAEKQRDALLEAMNSYLYAPDENHALWCALRDAMAAAERKSP